MPARASPPFSLHTRHPRPRRSEEHTSELQSLTNLVCRLLLEKKKMKAYEPPIESTCTRTHSNTNICRQRTNEPTIRSTAENHVRESVSTTHKRPVPT